MAIHRWRSALFQYKMRNISEFNSPKNGMLSIQKPEKNTRKEIQIPHCGKNAFSLMRILFILNCNWSKDKRNCFFFCFPIQYFKTRETIKDADTKTIPFYYIAVNECISSEAIIHRLTLISLPLPLSSFFVVLVNYIFVLIEKCLKCSVKSFTKNSSTQRIKAVL